MNNNQTKKESKIKKAFSKMSLTVKNGLNKINSRFTCAKGISTIEIILIIVVLIALIIIFRDRLITIVNSIFDTITSESGSV